MILADIPAGAAVFIDANIFIYHFAPDPTLGMACGDFLDRVSRGEIAGWTSADSLLDVGHRLMTIEAVNKFGWPVKGIAARLRSHSAHIGQLSAFRQAVQAIGSMGVQLTPVDAALVEEATLVATQHQLLMGDGLLIATMRKHGVTSLASHDGDFDRVPGITRYSPT